MPVAFKLYSNGKLRIVKYHAGVECETNLSTIDDGKSHDCNNGGMPLRSAF